MSTAATQARGQRSHVSGTTASYVPPSSSRQFDRQAQLNDEGYLMNQASDPRSTSQNARPQKRQHGSSNNSPIPQQMYYSSHTPTQSSQNTPRVQQFVSNDTSYYDVVTSELPIHSRNRLGPDDQYDGPPTVPARSSSQQQYSPPPPSAPSTAPLEERVQATRQARQATGASQSYSGQNQKYESDHREAAQERPRDDTATAAAAAARHRRKGPPSPDEPRTNHTRERTQQSGMPPQSRSQASVPAPLVRENSEVINRVMVSDPQVDAERMQERVAEAQPDSTNTESTPMASPGVAGAEGVDDAGRGPQRRQEFSKPSSRRKDVQFGDYMLGQTLGEGEFGKVKLGWKRDGSSQVAIKLIRKETVATNPTRLPKIYREISILRDLAHPNIVRLHEMIETERHIGIILEYASGGELFDYILNNRYLKDPQARRLFAQLVSGVGYLHKKGIVHRDLKLENLLLDQNKNIIITDFGFANTFDAKDLLSDEVEYNLGNKDFVKKYRLDRQDERGLRKGDLMQTSCGSPCYAAPELVVSDSLYTGRKVDVWSCGVILYAMLAGYLPFDDDPANPEGDNINLLYKYITTTPLTFPEYVSPHARDLLRRILVPDPRKRADLFEVARHSWLSEYHHVVSHITSSTTNIADIANSTVPSEPQASPILNRSASTRQPTRPVYVPPKVSAGAQQRFSCEEDTAPTASKAQKSTRHTLQPEYVAPQTHTARGIAPTSAITPMGTGRARADGAGKTSVHDRMASMSKPLPHAPIGSPSPEEYAVAEAMQQQQKMPPPVRPARDVPRSVSDSTGAFGTSAPAPPPATQQVTRPSTGGSLTSASGPMGTRSDLRLPSRGSYGQPVAPTVATTNVQGRVTQPSKTTRGYNISGPIPQHSASASIGQPSTLQMSPEYNNDGGMPAPAQAGKGHHRRTSTLSGLGERLFGRSGSVAKKREPDGPRQKNGKKYPPTSMKQAMPSDGPRPSIESKRSFSLGLGKKRSSDLESQTEKAPRRFSLINSLSLKGLLGGSRDQLRDTDSPQTEDFPPPPAQRVQHRPETSRPGEAQYDQRPNGPMSGDGPYDQPQQKPKVANFSRPPQAQYQQPYQQRYQQPASQPADDVYGSTAVYAPPSQYHEHSSNQAQPFRPQYPNGFDDEPRPSMQESRPGRLTKPNRKFTEGYDNDHHGGSSGAVKKVQDFFRRRGRVRNDSTY